MTTILTPAQTCGPLFGFALFPEGLSRSVPDGAPDAVTIEGTVYDGAGQPVGYGAWIEFWSEGQACRARTLDGRFRVTMRKPVPVETPGGVLAPSLGIYLFTRGLARPLLTRVYFPDEATANEADPIVRAVPAGYRDRMVARIDADGRTLRHDIHLQGERESVFFAVE